MTASAVAPQAAVPVAHREVPALTTPSPMVTPEVAQRTLSSGLRVLAVRRAAVPLVELRLRIPTVADAARLPASSLLADTALSGTATRNNIELAIELQRIGGDLGASMNADRLLFAGTALTSGLDQLLDLLAEVLTSASYPDREVSIERDRLVDSIHVALAQPATAANRALLRRLYGEHPYGTELPDPAAVADVAPQTLRELHTLTAIPDGAVLVLVGDIDPQRGLDAVQKALEAWDTIGTPSLMPSIPPWRTGAWQITDRPAAVQSSIRIAAQAVPRSHPDYPALQLANLIFGGYFSSRLVSNIREDKGYTYSPHSGIEHSAATSLLTIDADVATDVTAPALHEIGYELGRLATLPPTMQELEDVRQYAIGTAALSAATQSGLASWITMLTAQGLDLNWLAGHSKRIAATTLEEVHAAATRYLAPANAVTVVLGDAAQIADSTARLHPVEVQP